ncbi:AraC family transcriptional regulator [Martelella mediterranea]|uniref:AraC family transcriptional regulator n=1 Tax=Martelella mediterranea TaxID=293089 RepID=UPI001E5FFF59|nr:AraC family transcriptional regulator [Martelella mediterranea]MCD1633313.1 AraC family transcriptional regulator [Martelella mediterranea]
MGNSVLREMRAKAPIGRLISLPRGHQDLHAMPVSAGYEIRTKPDYQWDGRRRGQSPFSVIQYTIAGAGNLRFENQTYRIRPGETMLTLIPHNHRYWLEADGMWEFFWISLNGEEAMRIQRAVLATTGPVLKLKEETVNQLADCLSRLLSSETDTPARASAVAYQVTMLLYDDVFGVHTMPPVESRAMQRVIHYIDANLDKPLPVDRLAEISGFSRSHFSRLFAQSEGMPPAEYVLLRRLKQSTRLLASGDHTVKEVSGMAGFADPNYFAKVFRRYFRVSPTEFRKIGLAASIMTMNTETAAPALQKHPVEYPETDMA